MSLDGGTTDSPDTTNRYMRSFIARPTDPTQTVSAHDQRSVGDDIPLLTEVIDAHVARRQDIPNLLETLRGEIETEVSSWLVDILPIAVANASQQILHELDSKARVVLFQRLDALIKAHRTTAEQSAEPPPSL